MYEFDPATRLVRRGGTLSPEAALVAMQRQGAQPLRMPIGVIGPREAEGQTLALAEAAGAVIARCGFTLLCGGRQGVMEAASRGAAQAGGIVVGILPEEDISGANDYVTIPIATGIGEARNAIVARACRCLVAVGNSLGTLSEVALALRFGRAVFGLGGAAQVEGVRHLASVDDLAAALAAELITAP